MSIDLPFHDARYMTVVIGGLDGPPAAPSSGRRGE
jgi:hypothetical protein